ncbi:MAG: hypothetical protein AAGH15_26375 [Myxococcota bacterium]
MLVAGAFGGSVRLTAPQRLEAELPHGPLTLLMAVPALVFGVGGLAMLGLALTGGAPLEALVGTIMGLALAAALGVAAWRRTKSMGRFVIDGAARRVAKVRGDEEKEGAGFDAVARVERRWDPFHRGFVPQHWLVLHLKDGRRYRLGKGPREQVDATLQLLASWGVPVVAPR